MLKINRCIFLCLGLVLATGCTKYLDFEGEDAEPRLVLNGAFSPDSVFVVELSHSAGYISQQPLQTLHQGKVAVFTGEGEFLDSLKHQGNGIYKGEVTAQAGKSYAVNASAPSFENSSAVDYIPEPVFISAWEVSTQNLGSNPGDYHDVLQVNFTIEDPPETKNFYMLEFWGRRTYFIDYTYDSNTGELVPDTVLIENPHDERLWFETSERILLSDTDLAFDEGTYATYSTTFSDDLFAGRPQKFRVSLPFYSAGVTTVDLVLKSCSEAYYNYRRSTSMYYYSEGDAFSQPVQVFSNIQNGLGIWAGYSVAKTKIQ